MSLPKTEQLWHYWQVLQRKHYLYAGRTCTVSFYFISFAKKNKYKQTNKQKERWHGHRNSCGQLQRAWVEESISTTITTKRIGSRAIFSLFSVWKCILRPLQNDYRTGGKGTFLIDPQMVNERNILGNKFKNVPPFFATKLQNELNSDVVRRFTTLRKLLTTWFIAGQVWRWW